eukprot:CAMPEP_0180534488 /NCGR_PEP_ID=MMETSP1036_2-20121128/64206_1 /TAXON_ID=632150 /ORGANISM="Azadinium spinosum, Strain 3D9" /LENGTH=42 /DNA_ID= /DNA_START= /DNA_END= /DNA_ORIENTATION=
MAWACSLQLSPGRALPAEASGEPVMRTVVDARSFDSQGLSNT